MRTTIYALLFALPVGCSGADFDIAEGASDSQALDSADSESTGDSSGPDAIDEFDASLPDGEIADSAKEDAVGPLDSSVLDSGSAFDSGSVIDTGVVDTSPVDTGTIDTGTMDTSPIDTGTIDTGATDTGPFDTGTADTGVMDTGTADTGVMDTGTIDAGPADSGPMCPAPATTATFDASGMKCGDIPSKYASYLMAAKACQCDADCKTEIGRDFCGCSTFVNHGTDAYAALVSIRDRYSALSCVTACPLGVCPLVDSAKCVMGSGGVKTCHDEGP